MVSYHINTQLHCRTDRFWKWIDSGTIDSGTTNRGREKETPPSMASFVLDKSHMMPNQIAFFQEIVNILEVTSEITGCF